MVVRIPNWLGDAIMATPVYFNLCNLENVYLLGLPQVVELFKGFKNTEVLHLNKKNVKQTIELLRPLKAHTGLLLPNSFSSAWLFFKARLKERWGYAKDLRSCLLTKSVKPPKEKLHQRDYYLYLLKALGLPHEYKELTLPLTKEMLFKARELLKGLGENFVIIAPGAAYGPAKMWPKEYYRELAKKLADLGLLSLIIGTEKEKPVGDFICSGNDKAINLCGKTDLTTVAGIFSMAKAVISNDSGLMHLAAALKIPQVAIFGSTDPELTKPLNPNAVVFKKELPCSPCFKRTCKYGHYECLKSITPEEVLEQLLGLIF